MKDRLFPALRELSISLAVTLVLGIAVYSVAPWIAPLSPRQAIDNDVTEIFQALWISFIIQVIVIFVVYWLFSALLCKKNFERIYVANLMLLASLSTFVFLWFDAAYLLTNGMAVFCAAASIDPFQPTGMSSKFFPSHCYAGMMAYRVFDLTFMSLLPASLAVRSWQSRKLAE